MNEKKHHHYVPISYLNSFCDEEGKLRVYRKDDPTHIIHQKPQNVAFHKYYYSQPLPEGGQDNNALEDVFSDVESKWPAILAKLNAGANLNNNLEDLFSFISLQRARVPAMRDAMEMMLVEQVKATAKLMDKNGILPNKPLGFENILDHIEVAIDPHQSIHGMLHIIKAMGTIFDKIGIGAIHNKTNIPFLTSDNPVIWFDPLTHESELKPYGIKPNGPLTLLFPVSPTLLIYGHTSMHQNFINHGFTYSSLGKVNVVKAMNRHIVRFAYRTVFAQSCGQEPLIEKYAGLSPVLSTQTINTEGSEFMFHEFVFGKRIAKQKW